MIYNQNITLDLNTNTSYIMVGAKQGDSGRSITAKIMQNNTPFTIPQSATVLYRIHKPNGEGAQAEASFDISKSEVTIALSSDDLSVSGRNFADIVFVNNNVYLSTVSFIIDVQEAPTITNSIT